MKSEPEALSRCVFFGSPSGLFVERCALEARREHSKNSVGSVSADSMRENDKSYSGLVKTRIHRRKVRVNTWCVDKVVRRRLGLGLAKRRVPHLVEV